jgi:hypothetical protein
VARQQAERPSRSLTTRWFGCDGGVRLAVRCACGVGRV